jgi:hypothetical protein
MDLGGFSCLHSDIPGRFLTRQSTLLITVDYSLVYLAEAKKCCISVYNTSLSLLNLAPFLPLGFPSAF